MNNNNLSDTVRQRNAARATGREVGWRLSTPRGLVSMALMKL